MALASLLFATMGVCVKLASAHYATGEIVFYRGLVGALVMAAVSRRAGVPLRTQVPMAHLWRTVCGVTALAMWFYAIGKLPVATAMTLNYMSSVWMALFLLGGAIVAGGSRIDGRLIGTVLLGFGGVALVLRPTIDHDQLWHGLIGLMSGVLSALAYLQVTALGRSGEPESRIVFYFSIGGMTAGAGISLWTGWQPHDLRGAALLLAVGVLATAAQLMMTRAYRLGRTLVNASLQYLGIVFSFAYGVLLFDDPLSGMALAGTGLIVCAGLASTLISARTTRLEATAPTES